MLSDYRSRITVDRPIALSDKAVKEWKTFEDVVMVMTGRGGERGETVMFCYLYNSLVSSLHYLCLVPKKRNWFFTCLDVNHKWC